MRGGEYVSLTPAVSSHELETDLPSHEPRLIPSQAPGMLPAYNFLRKPAYHWGWDWGPALLPQGLPSPWTVLLFPKASARLDSVALSHAPAHHRLDTGEGEAAQTHMGDRSEGEGHVFCVRAVVFVACPTGGCEGTITLSAEVRGGRGRAEKGKLNRMLWCPVAGMRSGFTIGSNVFLLEISDPKNANNNRISA